MNKIIHSKEFIRCSPLKSLPWVVIHERIFFTTCKWLKSTVIWVLLMFITHIFYSFGSSTLPILHLFIEMPFDLQWRESRLINWIHWTSLYVCIYVFHSMRSWIFFQMNFFFFFNEWTEAACILHHIYNEILKPTFLSPPLSKNT